MDAAAQHYVSKLKAARSDEAARTEQRRAQRNHYLVSWQCEQQAQVRNALRLRVHQRLCGAQSAMMEQALFDAVRRTASWWDAICDHAVEQRLHKERAELNRSSNRTEYLRSVRTREHQEQRCVQGTDAERWFNAKGAFLLREKERQATAISGAVGALLSNVDNCADFLDRFAIESFKDGILARFGLSDVIQESYLPRTVRDAPSGLSAAREAFRTFFKKVDPLLLSSPYLAPLLRALLHKAQLEGCIAGGDGSSSRGASASASGPLEPRASPRLIFDISRVPIFAVSGAKFSGKSLLTSFLVTEFDFVCFSDRDLVATALAARAEKQTNDKGDSRTPCGEEALAADWADAGAVVESILLSGGSIGPALLARLVALQLRAVQSDPSVKGVVLDGVLSSAEAFRWAQDTLLPPTDAPLRSLVDRWCGAPDNEANGDITECTSLAAAWLPPPPPAVEEQQPKKDPKARATKKAVDMASLPPPTLPAVEDVSAEILRERHFIEQASHELATRHGGLVSAFFYMDCAPEAIFERYAGLRVDRETGEEYHMTYHPPPEERLAALVSADRTLVHTAQLADLVFYQQQGWEALRRWLQSHRSASAAQVVELDGSSSRPALEEAAANAVRQALTHFAAGLKLREAVRGAQERIRTLEGQRHAQEAAWTEERLRLVALYTERGVPQLPAELLATHPPAPKQDDATVALASGGGAAPGTATSILLAEAIPSGVAEVVFPTLAALTATYDVAYCSAHEATAIGVRALLRYRLAAQEHVRAYWADTPDAKQAILDGFVRGLNATPCHLRSRHICKEEMHGLADDLKAALFASVSARKRECAALIDSATRRDAFVETWAANVASVGAQLVQAEASRFTTLTSLVVFYFAALMGEQMPLDEADVFDVACGGAKGGLGGGMDLLAGSTSGDGPRASTAATLNAALLGGTAAGKRTGPGAAAGGTSGASGGGNSSSTGGATSSGSGAAGGKKTVLHSGSSASGTTGGGMGNGGAHGSDDASGEERVAQEAFTETVQRIVAVAHGLVDRLRAGGSKPGTTKGDKKAGAATPTVSVHQLAPNPAKLGVLVGKCLPILEAELTAMEERVGSVRDVVLELMRQGEAYRQRIRSELRADAVEVLKREAAAVNTAIYVVRCCIEEEQPAPRMHLGCGTFAVLDDSYVSGREMVAVQPPSFLTDVPLYQEVAMRAVPVHATLTAARLFQLIDAFMSLAPDHRLSRDDFMLTVMEADYAGAVACGDSRGGKVRTKSASSMLSDATLAAQRATEEASMDAVKSVSDVFRAFDTPEAGFIDWREFVVHLLLWCAPPPPRQQRGGEAYGSNAVASSSMHVPELSIERLLDARHRLGLEPLSETAFREVVLFPDAPRSEEHREVYTEALRRTFRDPARGSVDVYALLFFHCSDAQPIRGVQKAFSVLSSAAQAGGGVTRAEMERIFHTHAANPRALGRYDPFSKLNCSLLYGSGTDDTGTADPAQLLTFHDTCASLLGRKMLNTVDAFRRKHFIIADEW